MRRLISFCLAGVACAGGAGAVSASAAEQAAPYPTAAVLSAARAACSDLSAPDAAAAKVAAAGWTKAADPYATPVGELVKFGYEAGRKMLESRQGKLDGGPLVFSRQVAGETLHLVLSAVEMDGVSVLGCRTYDVGETRRISKDDATRWAGRAPDSAVERAELSKFSWEPGLIEGQDSFEVFYVPAGSPLIQLVKFPGIAIKADQVGTVQR